MIILVTGLPGNGKTFYLAKLAKEAIDLGTPIWVNFKLNTSSPLVHYYNDPMDLLKAERGKIFMDEAQIYFNSRKWESLDERVQYKLQQHRHDGLDLIGAVQSAARIDVLFRELVAEWVMCRKLIASAEMAKHPWGVVMVTPMDPQSMKEDLPKRQGLPSFFWLGKNIANFYDTLEKIPIPEKIGWQPAKVLVCQECGKKHYKAA